MSKSHHSLRFEFLNVLGFRAAVVLRMGASVPLGVYVCPWKEFWWEGRAGAGRRKYGDVNFIVVGCGCGVWLFCVCVVVMSCVCVVILLCRVVVPFNVVPLFSFFCCDVLFEFGCVDVSLRG